MCVNESAYSLASATEASAARDVGINCTGTKALTDLIITRLVFGIAYMLIFTLAVSGNSLVVYVVINNKTMQTVTNIFITNLAISDLLVNFTLVFLLLIHFQAASRVGLHVAVGVREVVSGSAEFDYGKVPTIEERADRVNCGDNTGIRAKSLSRLYNKVTNNSLWLTPVYTYVGHWIWGGWLCYGLPLFQGTSIFISTLTLMAIAIDRYFVIVHHSSSPNVNDHMSMPVKFILHSFWSILVCIAIITLIWTVSLLLVMPYAVHMRMTYIPRPCEFWLCIEDWAMEDLKSMYGVIVMALQFLVPFVIIGFSYIQIWNFLNNRNSMVSQRESEYENARKKRLLRMLIIMVVVFGICWFPFNLLNILRDLHLDSSIKPYFSFLFLSAHVISMTATCWNPIVYAWMNDAFRERFVAAVPFLSRWFISGRRSRPRVLTNCELANERSKLYTTPSERISEAVLKPLTDHRPSVNTGSSNENPGCSRWNYNSLCVSNGHPRLPENPKSLNAEDSLCPKEAKDWKCALKVEQPVAECDVKCTNRARLTYSSSSALDKLRGEHAPCTRFLSLDGGSRSAFPPTKDDATRRWTTNDQRTHFEMKTCVV
uniref:G-protein coupled receptors family 1 profile domain-containing protein n=1 Tax=Ascaris lumbricoides TaxID=6252 RepID=A0A9J2P3F8_ASCLU